MGLFGKKKHEEQVGQAEVEGPLVDAAEPYVVDLLYVQDPGIEATGLVERVYRPPAEADYEDCIAASGRWPAAREQVRASRYVLRMTATGSADDSPRERFDRLVGQVGDLIVLSGPVAIVSRATGEVLDPRRVEGQPMALAVNVRRFDSPSVPGATLMDTTGLAQLGVPDLQCHFHDLDPDALETYLYGIAEYLLDNGDFVRDGQALQGIDFHDRWKVKHQVSLAEPRRRVIDLNPGRHHAPGH